MTVYMKQRVLELFEEWKRDRTTFTERYEIPITQPRIIGDSAAGIVGDPAASAMRSIAESVLGREGWVVEEVIAADPVLVILRSESPAGAVTNR